MGKLIRIRQVISVLFVSMMVLTLVLHVSVDQERPVLGRFISPLKRGASTLNASGVTQVGDSAQSSADSNETRDVCERLLSLGLSVIPSDLQKECEMIAEESPDWVELFERFVSYVQWHKNLHADILANVTRLQETRTLTYNCDIFKKCTGLGATVKSIATGVLAAMYTKRFFIADQLSYQAASQWEDPVQNNTIHWKVETPTWDSFKDKLNVSSHVVEAAFNTSYLHVFYGHPSIKHHKFFCEDIPEVERNSATATLCQEGKNRNVIGFLDRRHEHFLLGATIRAALRFSRAVNMRTAHKLAVLQKKGLPSSGYLAVHLRTGLDEMVDKLGKYIRTGKFIQRDVTWKQHIDCALHKANASGLGRPILLVTDSSACREWTRAQYKPKDVLVTSSSFFHFSKEAHNPETTQTGAVVDMASEMDLLSRASILIPSSMSSFSEAAFYFSALPHSQLIQC